MDNMEYIEALTDAIKQGFSCEVKHIKSAWVKAVIRGKSAWEGLVEVFELKDHPTAKQAYGWCFEVKKKAKFATVLELPPVDSPETAVKAYLAGHTKKT
jgi:hypothetical protein